MPIPYTWIYLLHDPFTDLYKIGKSDDPEKRMREIARPGTVLAAPIDYKLVEAWRAPDSVENELHRMFKDKRVRGEWFRLSSEDVTRIKESIFIDNERWGRQHTFRYERDEQGWYAAHWTLIFHIESLHLRLRNAHFVYQLHGWEPFRQLPSGCNFREDCSTCEQIIH